MLLRCRVAGPIHQHLMSKVEHWIDIHGMDDAEVAAFAATASGILVDLGGHTAGNRLKVFGEKPAPVKGRLDRISQHARASGNRLPENRRLRIPPVLGWWSSALPRETAAITK